MHEIDGEGAICQVTESAGPGVFARDVNKVAEEKECEHHDSGEAPGDGGHEGCPEGILMEEMERVWQESEALCGAEGAEEEAGGEPSALTSSSSWAAPLGRGVAER